jgi:3-keto-disaccharide hydrolase
MEEWNHLRVICNGNRLTAFVNGTPVNQVDGVKRTKGAIAIKSIPGCFQAPAYYRNIRIQPLSGKSTDDQK